MFCDPLERAGLQYMVTGSVAGILYGEPRLTHDVDLVLVLPDVEACRRLLAAFPDDEFYAPPLDVVRTEQSRATRGHFNLIHHATGFKADIYPVSGDPLHAWGLSRRRQLAVGDGNIWVAPPEYVIVRKLEYFREGGSEKHLGDIRAMLRISGDEIANDELDRWVLERGLGRQWELITVNA